VAKEQLVSETYSKTARAVDESGIAYRLIDHEAEGQTDKVSALRGHPLTAAAKCIMLIVKLGKKTTRFVLAVVPGDRRVDIGRVRALFHGATYVGFAGSEVAERSPVVCRERCCRSRCVRTSSWSRIQACKPTLNYSSTRLALTGRVALKTVDYLAVAKPRPPRLYEYIHRSRNFGFPALLPSTVHVPRNHATSASSAHARLLQIINATKATRIARNFKLANRHSHRMKRLPEGFYWRLKSSLSYL